MPVLEGMSSLVDKSLIHQVDEEHGELRFAMLETVREYALEQLDASGERAVTLRAHAAYCIVLAEEGSGPLGPRRAGRLAGAMPQRARQPPGGAGAPDRDR